MIGSPSISSMRISREFLPWIIKLGTPGIRRFLALRIPSKRVKNIVHITDILDRTSQDIYLSKKQAMQDGDDAVQHQVGEGRDIMSVLCM